MGEVAGAKLIGGDGRDLSEARIVLGEVWDVGDEWGVGSEADCAGGGELSGKAAGRVGGEESGGGAGL